jgi:hypothetical protein
VLTMHVALLPSMSRLMSRLKSWHTVDITNAWYVSMPN